MVARLEKWKQKVLYMPCWPISLQPIVSTRFLTVKYIVLCIATYLYTKIFCHFTCSYRQCGFCVQIANKSGCVQINLPYQATLKFQHQSFLSHLFAFIYQALENQVSTCCSMLTLTMSFNSVIQLIVTHVNKRYNTHAIKPVVHALWQANQISCGVSPMLESFVQQIPWL